jgi:hypothetical protein
VCGDDEEWETVSQEEERRQEMAEERERYAHKCTQI